MNDEVLCKWLIKHSNTSSSLVRNFIQFSNIEKIKKYVLNETYEEIIKIMNSRNVNK